MAGAGNGGRNADNRRPPLSGAASVSSANTASSMSRAERFDDERRRITESCFSRLDEKGNLIESYITHIRVQEDATSPQAPSPPGGNPANKKARVIIISVRHTGRVRIHKARENANATFSIGKTWNMEELSAVENFVHMRPSNEEEAQRKRWAGDVGFTVTIQKPYYWEAATAKEKEFFISSIVKIYHKYTQGDFPVLTGFSSSELDALTGGRPHLATAEARAARRGGVAPTPRTNESPNPPPLRSPGMSSLQSTPPLGEDRERRPPPLRDDRRPPPFSGESRPPPLSGDRRPPPLSDDRRPPNLSDERRPSPQLDDRRPPPRRPPTAEGETRDRRPPPLRGPLAQMRSRDELSGPGTPPLMPYGQGSDGQRRPIPRPSMEQGLRSSPGQEQMNMRAPPSREQMNIRSPPSRDAMRPSPAAVPAASPLPQHLTPDTSRLDAAARPTTPDAASVRSVSTGFSPNKRTQTDDARSVTSHRSQKSLDQYPDGPPPGIFVGEEAPPNPLPSSNRVRDLSPRGLRPGTAQSNASSAFGRNDELSLEQPVPRSGLPERKRPPMTTVSSQRSQPAVGSESRTEFHTPVQSPEPPAILQAGRRPSGDTIKSRIAPTLNEPEVSELHSAPKPPPTSPLPQIPTPTEPSRSVDPTQEEQPESSEPRAPSPTKPSSPVKEEEEETQHRPGLGPMVKKKTKADTANAFRKAAFAAGAFKPRAGGAAAKLFAKETKSSDEPDGITGVFVPQRPAPKEEAEKKVEEDKKPEPDRASKDRPTVDTDVVPSVTVSSPLSPTPVAVTSEAAPTAQSSSPEKPVTKSAPEAEVRRKRRRSNQQIMNISKLGIDPSLLDDRGLEFENMLSQFGWWGSDLSVKSIDALEHDIKQEIARVEAGSWLNHLDQKDDRVEAVEKMLDRAIAECDELEGLLTLYSVELSSLNDDIAFIEAQGQGLQVQTANQRLLQSELQQLVETISITADQLEPLRQERIGKISGLEAIESALVLLYKALMTIDPAIIESRRAANGTTGKLGSMSSGVGNSELASMHALQEKKDRYLQESAMFLDRLKQHMTITFGAAFLQTKDILANADRNGMPTTRPNVDAHDAGRSTLWMFSPLILFTKEIDPECWNEILRMYQAQAAQVYQEEIRDNIMAWKQQARKPTGEEQDLLFTAQEKEAETIAGAARKLTVKRSQTLARGLRAASGEKESKGPKPQQGRLHAFDVFSKALDDSTPLLLTEQNFITDFFHATSTDAVDFPDAVRVAPPENRRGKNLWIRRPFEADRTMAKRVAEVMEEIFSVWPTEIQNLVEWAVKADPLQGVGILCAVDRKLLEIDDSNQDFQMKTLQKIHERLTGLFIRFVDEQIRAIEDTKVKIKKRKGVIKFMHTFPHFSIAIENMLPSADEGEQLEIRKMVDDAYDKINKAMFESLKVIAKESPAVMATQGQGDPEDKEALNYHILLIENMNHYMEEVDARSDPVLLKWKAEAEREMAEHMGLYVDAVIRRPLGKLLEFVESTENLMTQPGASAQAIAARSSHSRHVFKKLLHSNDAKELRKGIEALKKRVDKHFGDADDASIARNLVTKVYGECEARYVDVYDRTVRIGQDVYTGEFELDWGVGEIKAAFRR
ncbi:uncharacterized protein EI97DRAFT_435460 [Westerdykella ornata]|uniref:Exocyst complex component Sec3 PIP2-binding N-terminal domain-containing protein n=1 Tax=Westerdykella ornata TaxID=318751 RepID=A0A6A6JCV1_WESOR|nr:uncharacterized protein EI97DRAFT_435460 [Westerdykella ornata]KAF2274097.1 hypothetical protein EI97DRAFT_435460 [Westerdykella ornata]